MGGIPKGFRALFPKGHVPTILDSLYKAGETLQKKSPTEIENRLTRRLCIRMNQLPIFRDGPLSIHSQQELLSSDPDIDQPRGYIDILIACDRGSEVYFAIEAKRLRVRSIKGKMKSGSNDYVTNGMMRFVTGQYAPSMKTGAMLGYVFDGDIGKARTGIAGYIHKRSTALKLAPPKRLARSSILPGKTIDETQHDLKSRTFTIYHLLLSVI